jgi:hypothetical protein
MNSCGGTHQFVATLIDNKAHFANYFQKVNVYLPSLMIKVPNHLYVLGDTYTCHT